MSARAWDRRRNKARPRWIRGRYGCLTLTIGKRLQLVLEPSGWGYSVEQVGEPSNG